MNTKEIATKFYDAFASADVETLKKLYDEKLIFNDEIFVGLSYEETIKMWSSLLIGNKDMSIKYTIKEYSENKVKVTITGKVINEEFAKILINNPEITLEDIILLDKVQKQVQLSVDELKYLRGKKFIEGRRNGIFLSHDLVKKTGNKELLAEYVKNKSFDNDYYKKLILEYIAKSVKVKRSEIDNLVIPKLSEVLSEKQKKDKIRNFLFALGKEGKIVSREYATWEIKKD